MEQQPIISRAQAAQPAVQTHCAYCGSLLARGYYFCLSCATPHKSAESVLPAVYVAQPDEAKLIRRDAPHAWPLFWTYMSVIIGFAVISHIFFQGQPLLGLVVGSTALFITTGIFAGIHWRSLAVQFARFGFDKRAAWLCIGALVPLLAINYGLMSLWQYLLPPSMSKGEALKETGLSMNALVFFIAVMPAILEEIAFRGLLLHWLQVAISPMRALLLSSALFAALHFNINFFYLFGVGWVLGYAKLKTGSLYPSMVIHFLHNFIVVVYFVG